MSTSELKQLCYPHDLDLSKFVKESTHTLDDLHKISMEANDQVVQLVASRVGRDLQRYSFDLSGSEDSQTEGFARLTTGTIPILKDGRVLLVSSSTGTSWVLPKGGWETDEVQPVGAIRETFEEAGVVGMLGPPLPSATYETRKAKRKRIAGSKQTTETSSSDVSILQSRSSDTIDTLASPNHGSSPSPQSPREHTHNCLTMFPLYVTQISDEWPETHRKRRAFTVDEAIGALGGRPEFLRVMEAVKLQRRHLLCIDTSSH
jgi:diphosphoinositol-polyphosphate diphosphatase